MIHKSSQFANRNDELVVNTGNNNLLAQNMNTNNLKNQSLVTEFPINMNNIKLDKSLSNDVFKYQSNLQVGSSTTKAQNDKYCQSYSDNRSACILDENKNKIRAFEKSHTSPNSY